MRKIQFITICCFVMSGTVLSQTISTSPTSILTEISSCKDSVTIPLRIFNTGAALLSGTINPGMQSGPNILLEDDFDPSIDMSYWSSTSGIAASSCGSFNGTNALYFNSSLVREAITKDFDVSSGADIEFYLKFGSGSSPCEMADGGENVVLEYSNNGGVLWTIINTYLTGMYSSFTHITAPVPLAAQTVSTRFRWRQLSHSGSGYDHWSIDEVTITSNLVVTAWCKLSPAVFSILPGNFSDINVRLSSENLVSGTYNTDITINSNDVIKPELLVPCTLIVSGSPKISLSKTSVNFGTLQQFSSKTDTIVIFNTGCDTLSITNITSSIPEYTVSKTAFSIYPGESDSLGITFSPNVIDIFNSNLTIYNDDVNKVITLTGVGEGAPVMTIVNKSINVSFTTCGDSVTIPLKIKNTGLGSLTFQVEGEKNQGKTEILILTNSIDPAQEYLNTINAMDQYYSNYNYTEIITTDPLQLETALIGKDILLFPEAESTLGTVLLSFATVINKFVNDGGHVVFLGTYDNAKINNSGLFSCSSYSNSSGYSMTVLDNTHPITKQLPSTILGQNATFCYNFSNPDKVSLIKYSTYDMLAYRLIGKGRSVYIGYDFYAYDSSAAKILSYTIKWLGESSNAIASWIKLSDFSDTVAIGDSAIIGVTISTKDLEAGKYSSKLLINSNDPLNPKDSVSISLNHIGDPKIKLSKTTINFGSVMQYGSKKDSLLIINSGCDTLNITSLSSTLPEFTYSINSSLILPGDTAKLTVTFSPLVIDFFNGKLSIKNNDIDTNIVLSAISIAAPKISITPTSLSATSGSCADSLTVPLTINNTGLSSLNNISFSGGSVSAYNKTNTVYYTTDAELTNHTFTGVPTNSDSVTITVTLNGDYTSTGTEYANLIIEGVDYGQINMLGFPDGTDYVRTYKFGGSIVTTWLADGVLQTGIKNCSSVNIGYGTQMNKVQVQTNGVGWLMVTSCPSSIAAGGSAVVNVKFKNTGLTNGVHSYNLMLYSNDPAKPAITIPCTYTVQTSSCTDFSYIVQTFGGIVDFTDFSTGTPTSWSWNFGDGNVSNLQNPQHIYISVGTYSVSLTTSNSFGSSTKVKSITVSNTSSPVKMCTATFSNKPSGKIYDSGGDLLNYSYYENCSFLITIPSATSITLSFKSFYTESSYDYIRVYNGTNTSAPLLLTYSGSTIPNSVTANSGSMYITFTSNGSYNYSGFEADWTSVQPNIPPVAAFTTSYLDPSQGLVQFLDVTTNSPTSWNWNFGDGTSSTLQNPYKVYANSGVYTVVLTATNAYGSNQTTSNVTINKSSSTLPVSSFTYEIIDFNQGIVSFTDNSTNTPTTWLWDFGDGTTSHDQNPYKVYSTKVNRTVTLIVANSFGSNSSSKIISFSDLSPESITQDIKVYPNPNNGTFVLDLKQIEFDNDATIRIIDVTGRTIYNASVQDITNNEISVSLNLNAGLYSVVINTCDKTYTTKFIIQ